MKQPLRTPDERFRNLPEYDFAPHYVEIPDERFGSLRMHYLEEGPPDAPVVLLLHGQGSWVYLYRRMIPLLVAGGFRVIAPDYIGFGRSDKLPSTDDYTFQKHIDWMTAFFDAMKLRDVTAYLFDWGGFFALRIAAERPEFFGRLILSNTMLPTGRGSGRDWFIKWREQQFAMPRFPQGEMVNDGVANKLRPEVIAAFAGTAMGPERLIAHLPGARGQPHALLKEANFYITEDQSGELARRITAFARPPQH